MSRSKAIIVDSQKLQLGCNVPRRIPYASGWDLFKGAFFGRDSARIAQDEISIDRQLTKDVLLSLASLQGTGYNLLTEEEPGKIHHESRNILRHVQGGLSEKQREIIADISHKSGGNGESFTTYWSADATPAFLQTFYDYLDKTNDYGILKEIYFDKEARDNQDILHQHIFLESVEKATQYIADTITFGPLLHNQEKKNSDIPSLFSWQYTNDNGIHNQTLRDSEESEIRPDGTPTNRFAPRIDTGIQGMVYDCLVRGAKLFGRQDWGLLAKRVQKETLERLWMPNEKYFAMGLEKNPITGQFQQVQTLSISAAELLNSRILLDLPREERKTYIKGIIQMIFGNEFLTRYGIRTQAKKHYDVFNLIDSDGETKHLSGYHGAETVWPVLNGKVIEGLQKAGLPKLAKQITVRMKNLFRIVNNHVEFVDVGPNEELGVAHKVSFGIPTKYAFYTTNTPELIQGWSWSLHDKLAHAKRRGLSIQFPWTWQQRLDITIIKQLEREGMYQHLLSEKQIARRKESLPVATIDIQKGQQLQQSLHRKWQTKIL